MPILGACPLFQRTPESDDSDGDYLKITIKGANPHLLSEIPPRQEHHEVRPRNLAKTLGVILVKKSPPPGN